MSLPDTQEEACQSPEEVTLIDFTSWALIGLVALALIGVIALLIISCVILKKNSGVK